MCRKQPGIAIGRLCDKCDGKCPVCDSYVRPTTLVRICDECSFGNYQNKCVVCGGEVCWIFVTHGSHLCSDHIPLEGNFGRLLLLRMYSPRKRPRRMPKDHQSWIIEDRSLLPKEEFQEPLATVYICIQAPLGNLPANSVTIIGCLHFTTVQY